MQRGNVVETYKLGRNESPSNHETVFVEEHFQASGVENNGFFQKICRLTGRKLEGQVGSCRKN